VLFVCKSSHIFWISITEVVYCVAVPIGYESRNFAWSFSRFLLIGFVSNFLCGLRVLSLLSCQVLVF
jgi:hypothetical protein